MITELNAIECRIDEDVTTIEEPLPANNEEEAFRAPQVKLDTWKAGRPHSTVLDHSRSASFSVPEKSVRGPSSEMGDVIDDLFQQAEHGAYESPSVASVQVDAHESDANWPVNREIEPVEKAVERVVEVKNVNGNVSVMRKSSFLTARPFEARPVQLPIKRPNFAPMVFHPSRMQRAPEVRGFAALPSTSSDATLSPSSPLSSSSSPSSFPYYKTSPTAGKVRPVSFSIPEKHESGTSLIRNQLIQSAKRPSAEINDFYVDERHSPRSPLSVRLYPNYVNSINWKEFKHLADFKLCNFNFNWVLCLQMNAITEKSEDKIPLSVRFYPNYVILSTGKS